MRSFYSHNRNILHSHIDNKIITTQTQEMEKTIETITKPQHRRQRPTLPIKSCNTKVHRGVPTTTSRRRAKPGGASLQTFLSPFNFRTRYLQRLNAVSNYLEVRLKSLARKTDELPSLNIFLQTCLLDGVPTFNLIRSNIKFFSRRL